MQSQHQPKYQVTGRVNLGSLGEQPVEELRQFAPCKSTSDLNNALRAAIALEVDAMLDLVADADAFDLLELVRMRAIPPIPGLMPQSAHDGMASAIELIALVLISRGVRHPSGVRRDETRPHEVIEELHRRAAKLIRIATYKLLFESSIRPNEPLARLAAEYQSSMMAIRSMQYSSIHDAFNDALFNTPSMDVALRSTLGFTYTEFDLVRNALQETYSAKLTAARDLLGEVAAEWDGGRHPQNEERINQGRQALTDFILLPGDRAQVSAEEVAAEARLQRDVVKSVLDSFSIYFDASEGVYESVFQFLRGNNPFAARALLTDGQGTYAMISLQIGTDSIRRIAEERLKGTKYWKRYDKARMEVSERLTVEFLTTVLGEPPVRTNLKYFAPREGVEHSALDAACRNPGGCADQTEADALFLVGDVALCVEVKARSIADPARRGDIARFNRELTATIGSAASQARRLECLIEQNRGLWLEDGSWLDLSRVREVRSVAVGLDDFGPAGTALDELRRAGVITDAKLPWVTSLHDLAVICSVLDQPSELLLYIRRRSGTEVARLYRATDELDLFMLFMEGGLYVEPDPEETHRLYLGAPAPSQRDRRRFAESAILTRVGTHTDPLDAWMYYREGQNPFPAPKPVFKTNSWVAEFVAFLKADRKPGWFRFGADLLALSESSQSKLASTLKDMAKESRRSGKPHQLVHAYAGCFGYPLFFAQTRPSYMDLNEATDRLRVYMTAKKHQFQADRALGIVIDDRISVACVIYDNEPAGASDELDDLVERVGLRPVDRAGYPSPPSARRSTHRLRGRKPKKGKK